MTEQHPLADLVPVRYDGPPETGWWVSGRGWVSTSEYRLLCRQERYRHRHRARWIALALLWLAANFGVMLKAL